jgi:hypothetical protein
MYLIQRGLEKKLIFGIATELSIGEKFDDAIFAWKEHEAGKISLIFFQAKHKQNDNEMINGLLTPDKNAPFQVIEKIFIAI